MLWLFLGVLSGAVTVWFWNWSRRRQLMLTWYEWIIALVAVGLAFLAIQNSVASLEELEPRAAWVTLILFGFPALLLAVLDWRLIARRQSSAPNPATGSSKATSPS